MCLVDGADRQFDGADGAVAMLLLIGESFLELASLDMLTFIPLLLLFLSRHIAISPMKIRKVTAANDPITGHLIWSRNGVDFGIDEGSELILLLTKTVELIFIFSSSKCCSMISILYLVGWISFAVLE